MQNPQTSGAGDGMEGALAVFSAVEELSNTAAEAIVSSSPQLDRDAVRRYTAQALLRTVARVTESSTEDYASDEDAVLRDAARDMGEWIDRLPSDSPWVTAFTLSQQELVSVADGS